jgi:ribosome recycling factor
VSTTRARLLTAYGDRASLGMKPLDDGGMRVRIVLPQTTSPVRRERAEAVRA